MEGAPRPFAAVFQDILRNLQEIVRAEVRLAKAEVGQEIAKFKMATVWLVAGAIAGLFGLLFLLLAAFHALTGVMPDWVAALTLAGALLLVAALALMLGLGRLKRLNPLPERTVATMKENVTWARQSTK
jgi:Putative Actinobacterial Holin-X, holin superfamily III